MTHDTTNDEADREAAPLGDRLVEADQGIANTETKGIDPMFEKLLDDEREFEARVRRIAIVSWGLALGCLLLLGSVLAFLGDVRLSPRAEMGDLALLLLVPVGSVALLSATITSLTWLFRSRTPTLRAIAYRLEALERRISSASS